MIVSVTCIDGATSPRLDAFLRTLHKNGHAVTSGYHPGADIWLVDCAHPHKIDNQTMDYMVDFSGQLILMTLDDHGYFRTNSAKRNDSRIPDEIMSKAMAFAKIQWSHDEPDCDLQRQVLIHPFLVTGLPQPSKSKKTMASFYGLPTGSFETEENIRILACRTLKDKVWFNGGIVGQEPHSRKHRDITGISVGHRPRGFYLRSINNSLLSICLPGHSVLTYRLFETLGVGSCAVACGLSSCRWLNVMVPGEHFLEFSDDLSNLINVCEHALDHPDETLKIASSGHDLHNTYYKILPDGTLTDGMWKDIQNQWNIAGVPI